MTMLDRMRRHKSWLKWSLALVVATFILLYIPSFMRTTTAGGAAPNDVIAKVDGRPIHVATYQRIYQQQVAAMSRSYGELNEQMLRQLGIGNRVIQQLVDEEAMLAEANRLGIRVSDAELQQRIVTLPGFQENGHFIGFDRYRQVLEMQRPPLRTSDFEAEFRKELISEKLQAAITGWISVADKEVEEEYRRRNEKAKVELAVFTANQFRAGIQPTEAELTAQFNKNPEAYRQPEKRRVRYLSVDPETLRAKMTVTPQEVDARYQQNIQMYSTPEQVRASHILLKTEGKDEKVVLKAAEEVLAKVKAGGDFAALAKQYSEDEQSKAGGGDLDYFGKNAMDKTFEDAAWALQPGQTSELVKTGYGFHIIKLVDKRAANTRPLSEVRAQVEDSIKYEKAQAEAARLASEVAKQINAPDDLDRVAQARGLTVGDSGLFSREEPLAGIGFAPAVTAEAFKLEQGKVSGQLQTNQGAAFITLVEVKPSALPKLEDVKDKVKDDVIRDKAVEVARAKAATMAQAAKSNFAAAAKAAGVEVKPTPDFVTRGAAYPEVGVNAKVDDAVFALKAGETTGPIATENAVVIARVKERQDVNAATMPAELDSTRGSMLQQRRGEFFAAYMGKAKQKMRIDLNENTITALLGR
jgi:peptidyl-prolyl cis-trans isomerase D